MDNDLLHNSYWIVSRKWILHSNSQILTVSSHSKLDQLLRNRFNAEKLLKILLKHMKTSELWWIKLFKRKRFKSSPTHFAITLLTISIANNSCRNGPFSRLSNNQRRKRENCRNQTNLHRVENSTEMPHKSCWIKEIFQCNILKSENLVSNRLV